MADLVGDFCAWHHGYNGISAERAEVQTKLLRRLEAFLSPRDITQLTSQDLEAFLASCNVAPSTTLKHLKMVRPFFKWLWRNGHINGDQLMHLRGVQAPRGAGWSPPKPYTRHEIACFWEHFDAQFPWTGERDLNNVTPKRGEYWVKRWQNGMSQWSRVWPYARRLQAEAIVALALFGGLRRIEIFNLELQDMHYDNAYIRVVGAAKNPGAEPMVRAVPMTKPMREALANWIEFREQVLAPDHMRPWLSLWRERRLEPMSFSTLAHMMDKIGDGYELHRLRHTYATERLRAGMKIELLQHALGHTNIRQTLQYAKIGAEDVIRAADQTNDEFVTAVQRSHV